MLVALLGPAVMALGALWAVVDVAADRGRDLTLRYILLDPAHLIIAVGVIVSLVCVPLAFQVATAAPEDVELELFEPDPARQQAQRQPDAPEPVWEEVTEWE